MHSVSPALMLRLRPSTSNKPSHCAGNLPPYPALCLFERHPVLGLAGAKGGLASMIKHNLRFVVRSAHLFAVGVALAAPAAASRAEEAWTVGTLVCPLPLGASPGLPAMSAMQCHFRPLRGPAEAYSARVDRMESAEGEPGRATLSWYVMSREPDIERGALAGRFRLTATPAELNLATAPAPLMGNGGLTLRPILIQSVRHLNLAAGVWELTLDFGV